MICTSTSGVETLVLPRGNDYVKASDTGLQRKEILNNFRVEDTERWVISFDVKHKNGKKAKNKCWLTWRFQFISALVCKFHEVFDWCTKHWIFAIFGVLSKDHHEYAININAQKCFFSARAVFLFIQVYLAFRFQEIE